MVRHFGLSVRRVDHRLAFFRRTHVRFDHRSSPIHLLRQVVGITRMDHCRTHVPRHLLQRHPQGRNGYAAVWRDVRVGLLIFGSRKADHVGKLNESCLLLKPREMVGQWLFERHYCCLKRTLRGATWFERCQGHMADAQDFE